MEATYEKVGDRVQITRTTEMDGELFFEGKYNHLAQVVNQLAYDLANYPMTTHGERIAAELREELAWMPGA